MDWTMAFISVDTHTEVPPSALGALLSHAHDRPRPYSSQGPVNVQVGDTAQKQALDATVALTNTAVADRHGCARPPPLLSPPLIPPHPY